MPFIYNKKVAALVLPCLMAAITPAMAQVSPDILNLLIVASQKDNGINLDMVAELAIAADPDSEQEIRELVATLRQKTTRKTEAPLIAVKEKPAPPKEEVVEIKETPGYFNFKGWEGDAELNILQSSGNTNQQSFGVAGKLKRGAGKVHHTITSYFDLNKNGGVKDKQKWGLSYKLDYDFSEKLYVTGFTGYENDQFGAFRERITTSLGFGYKVIQNETYNWKLEGGPSPLFTRALPNQGYKSSFNGFASSIFNWTINDRSEFSNQVNFYFGSNSIIDSKTALTVKINGALSSKFSYDILYDRDAPLGRKTTDTVARAGLLYDF